MNLSRSSMELFRHLLTTVSLKADAPDFEEAALQVIAAKKEVAAALAELVVTPNG